jgi:hypothetical protein
MLEEILERLTEEVPEAIGAVVCDFEGETVVAALGAAPLPKEALERARDHVPKQIPLVMPIGQFLLRLAGAEPCALLRQIEQRADQRGAGAVRSFHARYENVEILVDPLPGDYYLVLVLRRPALASHARFHLEHASRRIAEYVV